MQVFLHADPNTDGGALMATHLSTEVKQALAHFGERITRVEAHLSDANSQAKSGVGAIHCTLEARLVGEDAVVVKHHADSAHQAIAGALHKLRRAVTAVVDKHAQHHPSSPD